jgi:hypothetical protein
MLGLCAGEPEVISYAHSVDSPQRVPTAWVTLDTVKSPGWSIMTSSITVHGVKTADGIIPLRIDGRSFPRHRSPGSRWRDIPHPDPPPTSRLTGWPRGTKNKLPLCTNSSTRGHFSFGS